MMRQAGRYLPEYRQLRARHAFLDCVHRPELAAELTLQPLRRFPFDAGIVFSDILVVLEAMGLGVSFGEGGPRISPTLGDGDLSRLRRPDAPRDFAFIAEALRLVRAGIASDAGIADHDRALIGFAGAPFTLACYAIEGSGSKDFSTTRAFMYAQPAAFEELMSRFAGAAADLLVEQLRAGADAVQLFDTWGGTLSRADYATHVLPHVVGIVERVHAEGGRIVLFIRDSGHLLDLALSTGADGIGIDWRADVADAASRIGPRAALQGNLDPALLFAPPALIRTRVAELRDAVGSCAHVLNLGHGVLPGTPIEGVAAFVDAARSETTSASR